MPSTYTGTELTGQVVHAYGAHVVNPDVVQKITEGADDNAVTTVVGILGEGVWGGLDLVTWGGRVLQENVDWHFHPGYYPNDALDTAHGGAQAPDSWIQGGLNYSGSAYVVVKLPAGVVAADDDDFSKLEIKARCLMVMDYDANGNELGLVYTANPANVFLDIYLNRRGNPKSRVHFPSWYQWKVFCQEQVTWVGGSVPTRPLWNEGSALNAAVGSDGGVIKSGGTNAVWDSAIVTDQTIQAGVNGFFEWDAGDGRYMGGLTTATSLSAPTYTGLSIALYMENVSGHVLKLYAGNTIISNNIGTWDVGDRFRIAVESGVYVFYKNGYVIDVSGLTIPAPPALPLHGAFVGYYSNSEMLRSTISPGNGTQTGERTRERFVAGLAFINVTDTAAAQEAVLYVSCGNYQDVDTGNGAQLHFIIPSNVANPRNPIFDFGENNIIEDTFKTYRLARDQKATKVTGKIRDLDNPYYKEEPIPATRDTLADAINRQIDAGEIYLGTMTQAQAKCVLNYQLRMTSDLDLFCSFEANATSFHISPGDVVTVTHTLMGWVNVKFLVIEAEDLESTDKADTKRYLLQLYNVATYSDSDQTPLAADVPYEVPGNLTAPPQPISVELNQVSGWGLNNVFSTNIEGVVNFAQFGGTQRARIWVESPAGGGATITPIIVTPTAPNFTLPAQFGGTYTVWAVVENGVGYRDPDLAVPTDHASDSVVIAAPAVSLSAPTTPTANFSVNSIEYKWQLPANIERITEYEIWSDTSNLNDLTKRVRVVPAYATSVIEQFTSGAPTSVLRWIRSVNRMGQASAFTPINSGAAVPVVQLSQITDMTINYDGYYFVYMFSPLPSSANVGEYQIADSVDFSNIVARSATPPATQRATVAAGSTITRYIRAVDVLGNPGTVSPAVVATVAAPPAPVISVNNNMSNPFTLPLKIETPALLRSDQVSSTIIELSSTNAFAPADIIQTVTREGVITYEVLTGRNLNVPNVYVRARYNTLFGNGANSNTLAYTFGFIGASDIAAGSLDITKFASTVRPPVIVTSLPALPNATYPIGSYASLVVGSNATLYKNNNNVWVDTTAVTSFSGLSGTIAANQIGNIITASHIVAGSIGYSQLANGLRPVEIVGALPSLPNATYPVNSVVILSTNSRMYKNLAGSWTDLLQAADLAGTINGSTQITAASITGNRLSANTITANEIAALTITAAQIAANTITAAQVATRTLTADRIVLGAITDSEVSASANFIKRLAARDTVPIITESTTSFTWNNTTGTLTWSGLVSAVPVPTNIQSSGYFSVAAGSIVIPADGMFLLRGTIGGTTTGTAVAQAYNTYNPDATGTNFDVVVGWRTDDGRFVLRDGRSLQHGQTLAAGALLPNGSIIGNYIGANVIQANHIAANTITAAQIAANTITAAQIAANTITAAQIAASTITAAQIAASTITAAQIASGTITAVQIAAGAITARLLAVGAHSDNLLINPEFDGITSGVPDGWYIYGTAGGQSTGVSGGNYVNMTGLFSGYESRVISVTPGEKIGITVDMAASSGSHNISILYKATAPSGDVIAGTYGTYDPIFSSTLTTTRTTYSFTTTVPAGMYFMTVALANGTAGQNFTVWNVEARRQLDSVFIADGAITANKIIANAIQAQHILAGAVTASKLSADSLTAGIIFPTQVLAQDYREHQPVGVQTERATFFRLMGTAYADNEGGLGFTAFDNFVGGGESTRGIYYGNGYLEFVGRQEWIDAGASYAMIGLGYNTSPTGAAQFNTYQNIDFAMYMIGATLYAYEKSFNQGVIGTYVAGDVLRIEISGTSILYKKNGVTLRTVAGAVIRYPMQVGVSHYQGNFPTGIITLSGTLQNILAPNVTWGVPVNHVVDAATNIVTKTSGTNANWTGGIVSVEQQAAGDAFVQLYAQSVITGRDALIGMANSTANITNSATAYANYFAAVELYQNGTVYAYTGGSAPASTSYAANDSIRVGIENGACVWRKNGIAFYTASPTITYPIVAGVNVANVGFTAPNVVFGRFGVGKGWRLHPKEGTALKGVGEFNEGVVIRNTPLNDIAIRTLNAIGADMRYRGNDTGVVPQARVVGLAIANSYITLDDRVFVSITADVTGYRAETASNSDTIDRARVTVLDIFGNQVAVLPDIGYFGKGVVGQGYYSRYFADPTGKFGADRAAIFKIEIHNNFGWSTPVYLKHDGTQTPTRYTSMPTLYNIGNHPTNLTATPISDTSIGLSWSYSGAGTLVVYRRRRSATLSSDWVAASGTLTNGTTSFTDTSGAANTAYEYCVVAGGTYSSNLVTATTLTTPPPAPTYPAPSGLSGSPSSTTQINLSWTANGTGISNVELFENGVSLGNIGNVTSYSRTGRTANTSYTYKVKNVYAGGTSSPSNEVTVTTLAVAPSANNPTGLSGNAVSYFRIDLTWTNNGSTGATIEFRLSGDTAWTTAGTVGAGVGTYTHLGVSDGTTYEYRVSNTNGNTPSNIATVSTPVYNPPNECVTFDMYITVIDRQTGALSTLRAHKVTLDHIILSPGADGALQPSEIAGISKGWTSRVYTIFTESGFAIRCSPSHPIIMGYQDLTGKPARLVETGETVLVYNNNSDRAVEDRVVSIETLDQREPVLIFHLKNDQHTFVAGSDSRGGIVSHNRKSDPYGGGT